MSIKKSDRRIILCICLLPCLLVIAFLAVMQYRKCFVNYTKFNTQNANARSLYSVAVYILNDMQQSGAEIPEEIAFRSDDENPVPFAADFNAEVIRIMQGWKNDVTGGYWYIRIEDCQIARVLYADHLWSGFVGAYPDANQEYRRMKKLIEACESQSENSETR